MSLSRNDQLTVVLPLLQSYMRVSLKSDPATKNDIPFQATLEGGYMNNFLQLKIGLLQKFCLLFLQNFYIKLNFRLQLYFRMHLKICIQLKLPLQLNILNREWGLEWLCLRHQATHPNNPSTLMHYCRFLEPMPKFSKSTANARKFYGIISSSQAHRYESWKPSFV